MNIGLKKAGRKISDGQKIIGIDLGGTTVKFAVLTSEGEIQQKMEHRYQYS